VLKMKGGTLLFQGFISLSKEYKDETDATAKKALLDESFEKVTSYIALNNSDPVVFGEILKDLATDFAMGRDSYPKTLDGVLDVMNACRIHFEKAKKEKKQGEQGEKGSNSGKRESRQEKQQDKPSSQQETSFLQNGAKKCIACGMKNHNIDTCRKKQNIPKDQWWVVRSEGGTKAPDKTPPKQDDGTGGDSEKDKGKKANWCNLQYCLPVDNPIQVEANSDVSLSQHEVLPDVTSTPMENLLILDSGSTIEATICNPTFLEDRFPAKEPLVMGTNAGNKELKEQGLMQGFGKVYFDESMMTNILGLGKLVERENVRVVYDNWVTDAFIYHQYVPQPGVPKEKWPLEWKVHFQKTPEGLYAHKPNQDFILDNIRRQGLKGPAVQNWITTIDTNKEGVTKRQFEKCKLVRDIYHYLGCPTVENFKGIIRGNIIQNIPITTKDIDLAEELFGPDAPTAKGKTIRKRPVPVQEDLIEIPREIRKKNQDLTLCVDLMFICNLPMLTCIDRRIKFRSLVPLDNRKGPELVRAITEVLRHYQAAKHSVKYIFGDGEFRPIKGELHDKFKIKVNVCNAGDHVPEAERNNRAIGERVRAQYHLLPYKTPPRILVRAIAMNATEKLNYFPARGGVSSYFSPHAIMDGPVLDYNKGIISTGAYVLADNHPVKLNTPATRALDAIYLRPSTNLQGGHEVMDLYTGKKATRGFVTQLPVTRSVIQQVDALGARQGIKSFKVQSKTGIHLYPANWTAGVDYSVDDEDDLELDPDFENEEELEEEDLEVDDEIDEQEVEALGADDEQQELEEEDPDKDAEEDDEDSADEDEGVPVIVEEDEADNVDENTGRPTRVRIAPDRLTASSFKGKAYAQWMRKLEQCHNITVKEHSNPNDDCEYNEKLVPVMAACMIQINSKVQIEGASYAQQYVLQKGLKAFGARGMEGSNKELDQLHRRNCFSPLSPCEMTESEKEKAQKAIMFLTEKSDQRVKGRLVYDGSGTRDFISREDTSSPTVSTEGLLITGVISAKENRDNMSVDVPNAFIQTLMPEVKDGEDRVIMKITGMLIDSLVSMAPEVYGKHVVFENGKRVLYVQVLRAIYGMLQASLLWYKKFRADLEEYGFKFNPYDACVANRKVFGSQHTICFHVDDVLSSHRKGKVNKAFLKWMNHKYGSLGEVKATFGKVHKYLGMTLDFSEKGKLKVDMRDYVKDMIDNFSVKFGEKDIEKTAAPEDLFDEPEGETLDKERAEEYHTVVAKGLFLCKRARPDTHTADSILCTTVRQPRESCWRKLIHMLKYLNGSREDVLTLSAENLHVIKWYVDASFAVHSDFKSHTGAVMTMGQGAIQSMSQKQKLNTKSSTEAELVAPDDASVKILWTKLFLEWQGYHVEKNIMYQDNKSAILLEVNGKRSSGKRTRALNIRYFFLTDQVEKKNVEIQYCPTSEMLADYMTKPLQGKQFQRFRRQIMGMDSED
jgi:hypothetical protein